MRKILLIGVAMALAGCANQIDNSNSYSAKKVEIADYKSSPYEEDNTKSISWNLFQSLDHFDFYCGLQAKSGYNVYRTTGDFGYANKYGDNLSKCRIEAHKQTDEIYNKFKSAKLSSKIKNSGESLFKNWTIYIDSLSTFDPVNKEYESDYKKSLSDFKIDIKK